jgi:hypothetical protein
MSVDGDQAILLVSFNASENGGEVRIDLPRNLIDSKTSMNTDKPFLVYEDDIDKTMSFLESKTTGKARALVIVITMKLIQYKFKALVLGGKDKILNVSLMILFSDLQASQY